MGEAGSWSGQLYLLRHLSLQRSRRTRGVLMQLEQVAQEGREKHRILLAEAEGSSGGAAPPSDIVAAGRGRLKGSREGARGARW